MEVQASNLHVNGTLPFNKQRFAKSFFHWDQRPSLRFHNARQQTSSSLCLNPSKIVLPSMRSEDALELTRISSKGQVVIPSRVREKLGIQAGNVFAVLTPRKGKLVVLKKIDSKSLQADVRTLREVERAWKEVERGEARRATRKRFVEELETW